MKSLSDSLTDRAALQTRRDELGAAIEKFDRTTGAADHLVARS